MMRRLAAVAAVVMMLGACSKPVEVSTPDPTSSATGSSTSSTSSAAPSSPTTTPDPSPSSSPTSLSADDRMDALIERLEELEYVALINEVEPEEEGDHVCVAVEVEVTLDWAKPSRADRDSLFAWVCEVDPSKPVVFGSASILPDAPAVPEVAARFDYNSVVIDRRAGGLMTDEVDPELFTPAQSVGDLERALTALRPAFGSQSAWVGWGWDAGAWDMAWLMKTKPRLVAGAVLESVPWSQDNSPLVYRQFLAGENVQPTCWKEVTEATKDLLKRRSELLPKVADRITPEMVELMGSPEAVYDAVALYLPSLRAQDPTLRVCDATPEPMTVSQLEDIYDVALAPTDTEATPWALEVGRYTDWVALSTTTPDVRRLLVDPKVEGACPMWVRASGCAYDGKVVRELQDWLVQGLENVVVVQGEADYLSPGIPDLADERRDVTMITVPDGAHGLSVENLSRAQRQTVQDAMERWLTKPVG